MFRNEVLTQETVRRFGRSRNLWVCDNCYEKGRDAPGIGSVLEKVSKLAETLVNKDIKQVENVKTLGKIMKILAATQSESLNKECKDIVAHKPTHVSIKCESDPVDFLKSKKRNLVLMETLEGFGNSVLNSSGSKRLESLSVAYETILHARNLNVITLPSLAKNVRLLKCTHDKNLIKLVGYPGGGSYRTVHSLIQTELPELFPPSNDFISVDDNCQVKRVVASRNLHENYKHSVKVSYFYDLPSLNFNI